MVTEVTGDLGLGKRRGGSVGPGLPGKVRTRSLETINVRWASCHPLADTRLNICEHNHTGDTLHTHTAVAGGSALPGLHIFTWSGNAEPGRVG